MPKREQEFMERNSEESFYEAKGTQPDVPDQSITFGVGENAKPKPENTKFSPLLAINASSSGPRNEKPPLTAEKIKEQKLLKEREKIAGMIDRKLVNNEIIKLSELIGNVGLTHKMFSPLLFGIDDRSFILAILFKLVGNLENKKRKPRNHTCPECHEKFATTYQIDNVTCQGLKSKKNQERDKYAGFSVEELVDVMMNEVPEENDGGKSKRSVRGLYTPDDVLFYPGVRCKNEENEEIGFFIHKENYTKK
uniref:Uncharacterized protein n=1 Tax=Rhabditophanes sp. KR3021 TaxID=114890 RepID=A0AC35UF65_9BILA